MKVKYTGTADVKSYTGADLNRALDSEGNKKVEFKQGETVEVPDEVGEALVSKEGIFGDEFFEQVQDDSDEQLKLDEGDAGSGEADLGEADSAVQQTSNSGPAATPTSKRSRGATTTRR